MRKCEAKTGQNLLWVKAVLWSLDLLLTQVRTSKEINKICSASLIILLRARVMDQMPEVSLMLPFQSLRKTNLSNLSKLSLIKITPIWLCNLILWWLSPKITDTEHQRQTLNLKLVHSIRRAPHHITRTISDRNDCSLILPLAHLLTFNFLTYDLGRKLAEKIKKEQAMTVNSLRLELSTLQKLVFE